MSAATPSKPLLQSSLLGLGLALLTTLGSVLLKYMWVPTFMSDWLIVGVIFVSCLGFALIEIPLMIYVIRNMAKSPKADTRRLAVWTNVAFVAFAVIYALPNIFLNDITQIWLGLLIASTSFLRCGSALVFLKDVL